jgi:hypothetical protein
MVPIDDDEEYLNENNNNNINNEDDVDDIFHVVAPIFAIYLALHADPVPENTCPLSGNMYYRYLMDSASDTAFFDVARMHKDISFIPLLHIRVVNRMVL